MKQEDTCAIVEIFNEYISINGVIKTVDQHDLEKLVKYIRHSKLFGKTVSRVEAFSTIAFSMLYEKGRANIPEKSTIDGLCREIKKVNKEDIDSDTVLLNKLINVALSHKILEILINQEKGKIGFNTNNPIVIVKYLESMYENVVNNIGIDLKRDHVYCIASMLKLRPRDKVPPPDMCDELRQLVAEYHISDPDPIFQMTIAYGCGNWRQLNKKGTWRYMWGRAYDAMIRVIEAPVMESNRWLASHVIDYPKHTFWNSQSGKDIVWRDSDYIFFRLTNPVYTMRVPKGNVLVIESTHEGATISEGITKEDAAKSPDVTNACANNTEAALIGKNTIRLYNHTLPTGAKTVLEINGHAKFAHYISENERKREESFSNIKVIVFTKDKGTQVKISNARRFGLVTDEKVTITDVSEVKIWECSCGHRDCENRHRLDAWRPSEKIDLRSFVASAVKGPQPNIQTGSFVVGIYCPQLMTEGIVF